MAEKRNRKRRAIERAERELAKDPTIRLLEKRIAYHEVKAAEERAQKRHA